MRLRGYLKLNLFFVTVLVLLFVGCSLKRTAVNVIGNALSGEASVYAFDHDPDLIREALPFALKTFEGLLAVSPDHRALLLAAASGFTGYPYLLQNDADRLDAADLPRARDLRARAHKLYLRGRDCALRGIELDHNGFTTRLKSDKAAALATTTERDVPFLYWAGASWAGALTAAKDNLSSCSPPGGIAHHLRPRPHDRRGKCYKGALTETAISGSSQAGSKKAGTATAIRPFP